MLEQKLHFTGCSSIQFLNSHTTHNTVSQATRGYLPLTVTNETPCYSIGRQVLSTQPVPREPLSTGGKHFNHVPLLTKLISLPTKGITQQILSMCQGLLRSLILTSRWFCYISNTPIVCSIIAFFIRQAIEHFSSLCFLAILI